MRLIDANNLLEEMGAGCIPILEKGISQVTGDESTIKDYIDQAPTIDAEPVRHGKWINKKRWSMGKWHKWLECSECNYQDYNLETYEAIPFIGLSNYCPNCGAKMK